MMFTLRAMKTYPSAQPLGFFAVELRVPWLEAKGNPLSRLAEWMEATDGAGYADSAYPPRGSRSDAGAETGGQPQPRTRRPQPPFERRAESRRLGAQATARSPGCGRASNTSLAT